MLRNFLHRSTTHYGTTKHSRELILGSKREKSGGQVALHKTKLHFRYLQYSLDSSFGFGWWRMGEKLKDWQGKKLNHNHSTEAHADREVW